MKTEDVQKILRRFELKGYLHDYPTFYDSDLPFACVLYRGENKITLFEGCPIITDDNKHYWKDIDGNIWSHRNFDDDSTVIATKLLVNHVKYELDWNAITSFRDVVNLIKNVDLDIKITCQYPDRISKVMKAKG